MDGCGALFDVDDSDRRFCASASAADVDLSLHSSSSKNNNYIALETEKTEAEEVLRDFWSGPLKGVEEDPSCTDEDMDDIGSSIVANEKIERAESNDNYPASPLIPYYEEDYGSLDDDDDSFDEELPGMDDFEPVTLPPLQSPSSTTSEVESSTTDSVEDAPKPRNVGTSSDSTERTKNGLNTHTQPPHAPVGGNRWRISNIPTTATTAKPPAFEPNNNSSSSASATAASTMATTSAASFATTQSSSASMISPAAGTQRRSNAESPWNVGNKRPKRPKKPLTAYSIYFNLERAKLFGTAPINDAATAPGGQKICRKGTGDVDWRKGDPKSPPKNPGAVKRGLDKIGKLVGKKWRVLPERERDHLKALAQADERRYQRELDEYQEAMAHRRRCMGGNARDRPLRVPNGVNVPRNVRPYYPLTQQQDEAKRANFPPDGRSRFLNQAPPPLMAFRPQFPSQLPQSVSFYLVSPHLLSQCSESQQQQQQQQQQPIHRQKQSTAECAHQQVSKAIMSHEFVRRRRWSYPQGGHGQGQIMAGNNAVRSETIPDPTTAAQRARSGGSLKSWHHPDSPSAAAPAQIQPLQNGPIPEGQVLGITGTDGVTKRYRIEYVAVSMPPEAARLYRANLEKYMEWSRSSQVPRRTSSRW